jgi:hypothetical protein
MVKFIFKLNFNAQVKDISIKDGLYFAQINYVLWGLIFFQYSKNSKLFFIEFSGI